MFKRVKKSKDQKEKNEMQNEESKNVEYKGIKKYFKNKIYVKNIVSFILIPILLNLMIEIFNRTSVIEGIKYVFLQPLRFLITSMIIMAVFSVALVFKRRVFWFSLVGSIFFIMGLINCIVQNMRVSPFNPSDIAVLDSAITLLDKYVGKSNTIFFVIGFVAVAIILVVMFVKGPKVQYKFNIWKNLSISLMVIIVTFVTLKTSIMVGLFDTQFTNLTTAYREYGFVYSFGIGMIEKGVKKPDDYSEKKIEELTGNKNGDDFEVELTEATSTPNIIFLQLESFFDIKNADKLEFNQNPIPYFNELQENYSSGYLDVFNVGYGTCNTEFEIMTSMNLNDFGPGEIPYKTLLTDTCVESIAYNLKDYGYSTHVVHNNDGTFYHRNAVFSHLGYDTFTPVEYMDISEDQYTETGWVKDECLTEEIINTLKSTSKQDYIYTISVQGHGNYPTEKVLDNPVIKLTGGEEDEGRKNAIEYYANQIYEMDLFIKELTQALEDYGEDTILVMYGDHLPGLGFSEKDLVNKNLYQTEYVIWDNMGLEKDDKELETFQLAPTILGKLNMNSGVINRFHQSYLKDEVGIDNEYLSGLQALEYDTIYGDKIAYGGSSPYTVTKMQMGIKKIEITNVKQVKVDGEEYVEINGKNFTKFSKVYVNGKLYDTEYVDTKTLRIKYEDIESLDSFVVSQCVESSGYVLSSTKEYLYYGDN